MVHPSNPCVESPILCGFVSHRPAELVGEGPVGEALIDERISWLAGRGGLTESVFGCRVVPRVGVSVRAVDPAAA
jgi:hypothetical protein